MGADEGFPGQLGPALLQVPPRLDEWSRQLVLGMAAEAAARPGVAAGVDDAESAGRLADALTAAGQPCKASGRS
jgi:hypothetical protein